MSIPKGATHKMNGSFYKGLEQSGGDLRLERIKVQVWDGVQWCEVFLNDNAPLVEIRVEPYKPVVGELVETCFTHGGWSKRYFIGITRNDQYVVENHDGSISLHSIEKVRPIKTEREQFIDRCFALGLGVSNNLEVFGFLYDDGARFKGPDDE